MKRYSWVGNRSRPILAAWLVGCLLAVSVTLMESTSVSGAAGRAAGDSAAAAPIGDLPGWRQTFVDDFSTDVPLGQFPVAVADRWDAYPSPWRDSTRHGVYSPQDVVSIKGGMLNNYIHSLGGRHDVAAVLPKVPGSTRGQLYGRFAVRWRADELPGYKVAWLLWPDSGVWPRDGEIDFPEMNLDTQTVSAHVHRQDATRANDAAAIRVPMDPSHWHTTVVEWSPNLVVFLLDGAEVGRTTRSVPDTSMHWVLQTETKLSGTRPAVAVAGNVQVDWVAVWSYDRSLEPGVSDGDSKVVVTSPTAGSVVSGRVGLAVDAADPSGITAVKWYVDGREAAYSTQGAPWRDSWDSGKVNDGRHRMFTKARIGSGRWITSRSQSITVNNS